MYYICSRFTFRVNNQFAPLHYTLRKLCPNELVFRSYFVAFEAHYQFLLRHCYSRAVDLFIQEFL